MTNPYAKEVDYAVKKIAWNEGLNHAVKEIRKEAEEVRKKNPMLAVILTQLADKVSRS